MKSIEEEWIENFWKERQLDPRVRALGVDIIDSKIQYWLENCTKSWLPPPLHTRSTIGYLPSPYTEEHVFAFRCFYISEVQKKGQQLLTLILGAMKNLTDLGVPPDRLILQDQTVRLLREDAILNRGLHKNDELKYELGLKIVVTNNLPEMVMTAGDFGRFIQLSSKVI